MYCFDLTFNPHVAVASPLINNGAMVGTGAPATNLINTSCPAPYTGAAARTYAASPTADNDQIDFAIVFR